jgi:restriction system protein
MTINDIPKYAQLFPPIMEVINELGGSASKEEINDLVIEKYGDKIDFLRHELNNQESDKVPYVKSLIGWARNYLVFTDIIQSSEKGVYSVTEKGQKIEIDGLEALKIYREAQEIMRQRKEEKKKSEDVSPDDTEKLDDDLVANYRIDLLNILKSLPPAGFERICQRLLREAGFEQVTVTGKAGDGGIDGIGILQVNPFMSFKVIFQCKRYQGTVSAPQIRDFRGAMIGRADKGIFITTGSFTVDAKKEARREGSPQIELVDGDKLIEVFEKHKLGLKPIKTFEIDHKFFNEYMQ